MSAHRNNFDEEEQSHMIGHVSRERNGHRFKDAGWRETF